MSTGGRERKTLRGSVVLMVLMVLLFWLWSGLRAHALEVASVPWLGSPEYSHPTWSGKEITLKGTVRYEGTVTCTWDFGDGSPEESTDVTAKAGYPFPVEAKHPYTGPDGRLFVARLTCTAGGESETVQYRLIIVSQDPPTLDARIDVAIDEGLWWLYKQAAFSSADGVDYARWGSQYIVAHTGLAVQAFEHHFVDEDHFRVGDPKGDPYLYAARKGLNHLLSRVEKVPLVGANSTADAGGGDEDGSPNGFGLSCYQLNSGGGTQNTHEMYEVGIAMMAVIGTHAPGWTSEVKKDGLLDQYGNARTYNNILQDMADFCAFAQNDPNSGNFVGGWRYRRNYFNVEPDYASDNSVSQWPIIGIHPGEAGTQKEKWQLKLGQFGPNDTVKTRLLGWLGRTHRSQDPHADGLDYRTNFIWPNIAKTAGTGITGYIFCGLDPADLRIRRCVEYVGKHWRDVQDYRQDTTRYAMNFGNVYAMYGVKKAFEGEFLERDPYAVLPGTEINWYVEYAEYLTRPTEAGKPRPAGSQMPNGRWVESDFAWGTSDQLTTAFALLILIPGLFEHPPTAIAKANGADSTQVDKGDTVKFDASSSIRKTYPIIGYHWDFGDGKNSGWLTVPTATHEYEKYIDEDDPTKDPREDPYEVTLTVKDGRELITGKPPFTDTDTCLVFVHVPPHPPIAVFEFRPPEPCVNQVVTLDGSASYDPNETDEIVAWLWDIDSDKIHGEEGETGEVLEHTWTKEGEYPVCLLVVSRNKETGVEETSDVVCKRIKVTENPSPVAIVVCPEVDRLEECPEKPIEDPIQIGVDQEIQLDGTCSFDSSCEGPDEMASYAWDLDGDGRFGAEDDPSDPTTPIVPFKKSETGLYEACFKVTDAEGEEDTVCRTISICCAPPGCVIEANGTACTENAVCVAVAPGETVLLDGSKSVAPDPGSTIKEWLWDLTGNSSYGQDVEDAIGPTTEFRRDEQGDYEVGLKVVLECGGDNPSCRIRTCETGTVIRVGPRYLNCEDAYPSAMGCWPPNHKFILVNVLGVTGPDDSPITITIDGITQDEPVLAKGQGSGRTCPDGVLVDADGDGNPEAAGLRCERDGTGYGRVYTVQFSAVNEAGITCKEPGFFEFCVRHDMGGDLCRDDGQDFDSLECPDSKAGGGGAAGKPVYTLAEFEALAAEALFLRGDVDWSDAQEITDAILILRNLFIARGRVDCPDASDVNDDGKVDLSDAISLFSYLYLGSHSLPPPAGILGPDPTLDGLGCE